MGGGGFLMEPDNPLLDDFVLSLARRTPARVCFIPTASADSAPAIVRFYRAFAGKCIASDLTFFDSPALPRRPSRTSDLAEFVAQQDVFYVGGGNTANLLSIWRAHRLDQVLTNAWRDGAVLAGVSAGMLCWFRGGVTDSYGGYEPLESGLRLIDALACPHWDGEAERQDVFRNMVRDRHDIGYAADDGAALHFRGGELVDVIASRRDATAYRLSAAAGAVNEERLRARYLGEGGSEGC